MSVRHFFATEKIRKPGDRGPVLHWIERPTKSKCARLLPFSSATLLTPADPTCLFRPVRLELDLVLDIEATGVGATAEQIAKVKQERLERLRVTVLTVGEASQLGPYVHVLPAHFKGACVFDTVAAGIVTRLVVEDPGDGPRRRGDTGSGLWLSARWHGHRASLRERSAS